VSKGCPIDKARCNCAVVGVSGAAEASRLAYLALYAQQHRGQESSGIVASDGKRVSRHVGRGLVADVFSDSALFYQLGGYLAIGHNRYSTTGSSQLINAQPLLANFREGPFAISHNGNFTNSAGLRRRLEEQGSLFQTSTDTEVVPHLIARSRERALPERIADALCQLEGAYSLVMMCKDRIYAARDPHGFRPLCLGRKDGVWFVVSETCALDLLRAEIVRDIEPGELIEIHEGRVTSFRFAPPGPRHACIFEFVYFARPDSRIFDENVDRVRRKLGKNLALESPADADIVISVPDSSNTAAVGYARRTGIKFELGLIRNHYVGRTFIHPQQDMRDFSVRIKFNTVKGVLQGRRVVVVEDSIVRGTTLRQLVSLVRQAGAREVHVRVSSPPILSPCYYGMDFPSKSELIATSKSIAEIQEYIQADSLAYLSIEGLLDSVTHDPGGFCTACFTGDYPVAVEEEYSKHVHEQA